MKAYKLNPHTLQSIEDIAQVLDGLGLVIRDDAPVFEAMSKFFTEEVAPPAALENSAEAIAQD
jgi:hypothetical protein